MVQADQTYDGRGQEDLPDDAAAPSFELLGWSQVTVVVRFWIIAGVCVAAGLGILYSDWVVTAG